MRDAYRDQYEAALMQLEAVRRENAELRDRLGRLRAVADAASRTHEEREGRVSPAALASMLVTMFFLTGAVIYAGAVSSLHALRAHAVHGCPYGAGSERLAGVDPSDHGALQIAVEGAAAPVIEVDGVLVPTSDGIAVSGPLVANRPHRIVVRSPGCPPYNYNAWVHAGVTRTLELQLTSDRCLDAL